MSDKIEKRTFYRLITPAFFSDQDFSTLEEAEKKHHESGVSRSEEHRAYWEKFRDQSYIVKVEQTITKVTEPKIKS